MEVPEDERVFREFLPVAGWLKAGYGEVYYPAWLREVVAGNAEERE
jgi:hypothetical protein